MVFLIQSDDFAELEFHLSYMRKVKFTQEAFDERLSQILSEFPILDVSFPGDIIS